VKTAFFTSGYWKVGIEGLDEATALMAALPGNASRARVSALKSVGWWVRGELRSWVETSGQGSWEALHPITQKLKKRSGKSKDKPLYFLGRFARYRVDDEGTLADIDFGKSRKGKPGTFDPTVSAWVMRAETGWKTKVTENTRQFFAAATRKKRPKKQKPGETYFPLKKTTTTLEIPKRPIFAKVKSRTLPEVPKRFKEKFWLALARYMTGAAKPMG